MQCSRKRFTSTCAQRDYASCRGMSMRRRKPSRRSRASISERKELVKEKKRSSDGKIRKRREEDRCERRGEGGRREGGGRKVEKEEMGKKNKKKEAESLKLTYYNRANTCDLRSIRRHLVSRMQFYFFFFLSCSRHLASLQRKSREEALWSRTTSA